MIDPFTEMVSMMREQGAMNSGASIKLATMSGPQTCNIDDMTLTAEDLYIPDRLLSPVCTKVNVPESHSDASSYSTPLQAGDIVVIYQLSEPAYVILDRVVRGG